MREKNLLCSSKRNLKKQSEIINQFAVHHDFFLCSTWCKRQIRFKRKFSSINLIIRRSSILFYDIFNKEN